MKELLPLHKRTLTALLFLSLLSASCRKLISIPPNPPTAIPQTLVFSDSSSIQSAVAGVYVNFKAAAASTSWMNGSITVTAGLSADELASNSAFDQLDPQFANDAVAIDNTTVASNWKQAYSDLYQMNVSLENIGSTKVISDSLKHLLVGQLKVIRAWYYFHMVNLWGGVPVVTSSDYAANAILPRATVDSVYAQIQSDLADARVLLPAAYAYADRARPNLYVAEALSAKVYLYRQDWANAAVMASQVINSGMYSLLTDLNSVFLDGSNEAVWQLPAVGSYNQTAEGYVFNPPSYAPTPAFSFTSFQQNAFETGDLRLQKWVKTAVVSGKTYYYPYKYKNKNNSVATKEDYMILRFSEQYLILAEAEAHNGQQSDAITNLNMVRTRAGLAGSTASSQTDVLNAVMHERQTELFCEWGNRWYDLKRTGTIDQVLGAEKPGIWQPYAALYPVPKVELQNNPFLTQNPNY
ncbi:MAG TPA: RagB/SusD family nutrient uptake outer membrane protein [Puia sp.]|nr:RagB/SusD family nutrient uptake outer membrane protein [Puia sp.]